MAFFVTDEFVSEVHSILKTNSHSDCEEVIIRAVFNATFDELCHTGCKRLGGDPNKSPFLRKRIETDGSGKSSGYRLYFWVMITGKDVYLLFIHPKTGRKSGTNLTTDKQKELVKTFVTAKRENLFKQVEIQNNRIVFSSDKKVKDLVF